MAYTTHNFKSKKQLKESVKNATAPFYTCYQQGLGPDLSNFTGKVYLEGPHYPAPHTWYAEAELVNGKIVKVK